MVSYYIRNICPCTVTPAAKQYIRDKGHHIIYCCIRGNGYYIRNKWTLYYIRHKGFHTTQELREPKEHCII
jgi:hypothetical protein